MQSFDDVVSEKVVTMNCYELQHDPDFQEYINGIRQAMGSVDENLIGVAVFNYLYFLTEKKLRQRDT